MRRSRVVKIIDCPQCGRPFEHTWGRKYCSQSCGVAAYHARQRQARERPCRACGAMFAPYPSAITRGPAGFCSRACYLKVHNLRPMFIEVTCEQCGATYRRTRAALRRTRHTYCSIACAADAIRVPVQPHRDELNRGAAWQKLAERVRERDGRLCRICGKDETENRQRLSVDHVLPWRDMPEIAADESNLVSLCRSCHAKKTARAERRWRHEGDAMELDRYRVQLRTPSQVSA